MLTEALDEGPEIILVEAEERVLNMNTLLVKPEEVERFGNRLIEESKLSIEFIRCIRKSRLERNFRSGAENRKIQGLRIEQKGNYKIQCG